MNLGNTYCSDRGELVPLLISAHALRAKTLTSGIRLMGADLHPKIEPKKQT
jgi:hypothetical protein